MGAPSMANDPIQSGEFNQAMEMIRAGLTRLETGQTRLEGEVANLYTLHRTCMIEQNNRSFMAGQESEKIKSLEDRADALENSGNISANYRRQLAIGVMLTSLSSVTAIIIAIFFRK